MQCSNCELVHTEIIARERTDEGFRIWVEKTYLCSYPDGMSAMLSVLIVLMIMRKIGLRR